MPTFLACALRAARVSSAATCAALRRSSSARRRATSSAKPRRARLRAIASGSVRSSLVSSIAAESCGSRQAAGGELYGKTGMASRAARPLQSAHGLRVCSSRCLPSPTSGCCSRWRSSGSVKSIYPGRARCARTCTRSRSASTARPGPSSARWARRSATAGRTCRSTSVPALVFLVGTPFLVRLVSVARAHNVTSIADFVSSRFGKSPALAALVAGDRAHRRRAVPVAAVQGGRREHRRADGIRRRAPGLVRGHGAVGCAAHGAVRRAVRHATPRCHGAPRGRDGRHRLRVRREAARVRRGRRVRAAAPRRGARRSAPRA